MPAWVEWVRNCPVDAKDIHIEGKWDSFSTLLLLRMPVAVWNLLPDNEAYSFVGFVTSPNTAFKNDSSIELQCPCGNKSSDLLNLEIAASSKKADNQPNNADNMASKRSEMDFDSEPNQHMISEGNRIADLNDPFTATPISSEPVKKKRTNVPWTPAEEQRLKTMRDSGSSWTEIAKIFPSRNEGSIKKHWYKDMNYAEFAED